MSIIIVRGVKDVVLSLFLYSKHVSVAQKAAVESSVERVNASMACLAKREGREAGHEGLGG